MGILTELTCVACRPGVPTLTDEETTDLLPQVPEWDLIKVREIKRLRRRFQFKNFADALAFTNIVGELAEEEGHHPRIVTEWGRVTVTIWTHAIRGLHQNDFILAAKIDQRLPAELIV